MDFVAFDFETANSRADSACQLAAVSVRSGQIVSERSWLIRPPQLYFSRRNISIHGIRPEQVADAASMAQLWPELLEFIEGEVLVAHNASFDIGVLVASLAAYDIACPHIEFSCTRAIARRVWPGRSGYGLKPLGTWLGVDFRHHDALEDSRCCARIALAAAASAEAHDFPELERRLKLSRGRTSLGRVSGPRTVGGRSPLAAQSPRFASAGTSSTRANSIALTAQRYDAASPGQAPVFQQQQRGTGRGQLDPQAVIVAAAGSQPLARKRIVCLGSLRGLTMLDTQLLLEALGATWQTQIASDTDYVVACGGMLITEASQVIANNDSNNESKVNNSKSESKVESDQSALPTDLADRPAAIRLLSERQFLALLPAGKASIRW